MNELKIFNNEKQPRTIVALISTIAQAARERMK